LRSELIMSWLWPFSGPQKKTKPDEPMVAANDPALRAHFEAMLDYTEPPAVFAASEVAIKLSDAELANLGFGSWRDALPAIKALAWESRELGDCLIYFPNGKKVPKSVSWMEVGPIRVRRKAKVYSVDDWD
jgi:hypothetical protein